MSESDPPGATSAVEVGISDVDELGLVLPGARFGLARVDRGTDATRINSGFHPGVSGHEMDFGFSVLGGGAIDDSTLIVGMPTAVGPAPTLWDGVEVSVGDVFVYGPGSVHHCFDGEGLIAEVLCLDYESLRETAEVLGADIGDWDNRQSWAGDPGWPGGTILDVGSELDPGADAGALLSSVALTLSSASFDGGSRRALSSTEIVGRCFEYLETTGSWFPSIAELCKAVGSSERRLRQAFIDRFDRPPSQVLRTRALSAVRQALCERTLHPTTVSIVATDHGFRHLGDFGRYYYAAFGETPSQTLHTASTNHNGSR